MSYQLVTPHPHQRFPRIPGNVLRFPPFRGPTDRIPRNPGETRGWDVPGVSGCPERPNQGARSTTGSQRRDVHESMSAC